jgi:hypothetical protein
MAKQRTPYYIIVGRAAAFLALICFVAVVAPIPLWLRKLIVSAWFIGPPGYFFWELHRVRERDPDEMEHLKESQEKAEKIWAGVAAALALLYFSP